MYAIISILHTLLQNQIPDPVPIKFPIFYVHLTCILPSWLPANHILVWRSAFHLFKTTQNIGDYLTSKKITFLWPTITYFKSQIRCHQYTKALPVLLRPYQTRYRHEIAFVSFSGMLSQQTSHIQADLRGPRWTEKYRI
jgi:hypothetical protein